ncbi:hypothetical protein [Cypionkella psychrotolerans]|uniref:hypothetical protein n=1 Tax=Cypionkella psychrotolerans TaxID=1678131 RepID=UPI000B332913|nr:hypothetical protein [Cypionkella psychrotolerans]
MAIKLHTRTEVFPALKSVLRRRSRSVLPDTDHEQLQRHLEACEREKAPFWTLLAYVLHNKIANIETITTPVEQDIVTSGCRVSYSVNGGSVQSGLLVHKEKHGDQLQRVIAVPSLLGATLIGMRIGQRAPLLCEGGAILSIVVVDVEPAA